MKTIKIDSITGDTAYDVTLANTAHYVVLRLPAGSQSDAEKMAEHLCSGATMTAQADEEHAMQTGDEPQTYDRDAFTYRVAHIEKHGRIADEAMADYHAAIYRDDIDTLMVDSGGNG
jgi:hypothetical protein